MFGFTTRKELKKIISVQDNTISTMRKDVAMYQSAERNKNLEITRLAAENAVLKQRIIKLEEKYLSKCSEVEKIMYQYENTGTIPITTNVEYKVGDKNIEIKQYAPFIGKCLEEVKKRERPDLFELKPTLSQDQEIIIGNKVLINPKLQAWYDRGKNKKSLKKKTTKSSSKKKSGK